MQTIPTGFIWSVVTGNPFNLESFIWLVCTPTVIFLPIGASMFCVLSMGVALHYKKIGKQIKSIATKKHNLDIILAHWSEQHSLMSKAVRRLENYFQNILLLSISCIFLLCINYSVFLYESVKTCGLVVSGILFLVNVLLNFILLEAICYAAEFLKEKVNFSFQTNC